MSSFKERISSFRDRDRNLLRVSHSPFLISYFLLIIPLSLLAFGFDSLGSCNYNCGWDVQDWHLNLLAIVFAALVQPIGSLLLSPASPHPSFLSRLNPLIGMVEGMTTLFTLLTLHFSTNPLSYPAAATLTLYRREASSLTPTQLEDICSSSSQDPKYTTLRTSLNFSPLHPRSTSASSSLYVFGLFTLIRFMLNKWMYNNAPLTTMLCFHYIVSFGFLHLAIVLATSRSLTADEETLVEEQFQTYLFTHQLQDSLAPETSSKNNQSGLDDSWRRVLIFIGAYVFVSSSVLMILKLIFEGPAARYNGPGYPTSVFPFEMARFVFGFPLVLLVCFVLMKLGNSKGRKGKRVYWSVAVASVLIESGIVQLVLDIMGALFLKAVW